MSKGIITVLTGLLLMVPLTGCGRKTGLVPPQKLVPEAINDLRYTLDEKGVTLIWSFPIKMENGEELQAIESFEIYRAIIPKEEFCEGCPVSYEEPVEIDGGRLPATGEIRTALYAEGYLQSGLRYYYKVRSRAGWWYPSRDSNVVSFVWHTPPAAPQGLQLEPGDRKMTLTWNPAEKDAKGNPLGQEPQYQVYRKSDTTGFMALQEPVHGTSFTDSGLENEKPYFYRVRTVLTSADTLQEGGASQVVSGVPRDLTPPLQPRHLVAIEIPAGVKLAWSAIGGNDLAGYRIYRRQEGAPMPELLAEVGPDQNQYIDQSPAGGRKWFYSVTSFDTAKPTNESLPSPEAVIDLQ